jgi:outer membrane lipoprotein-sorting protein
MFWRSLAAATAAVVVTATSVMALPRTMQLEWDNTVNQGTEKVTLHSTTRIKDNRVRIDTTGSITKVQGAMPNSTIIVDVPGKVAYMLNDKTKTATKVNLDQAGGQMGLGAMGIAPKLDQVTAELKKRGAKVIGKDTLLGHPCEIYQMTQNGMGNEPMTSKIWIASDLGMPLKVETSSKSKGMIGTARAQSVKTNVTLADSLFQVPAGYKVTDMAELAKRMQEMSKKQQAAPKPH